MRIAIVLHCLSFTKELMENINERHQNIIKKYRRMENIIELVNGDIIKGYSAVSRKDGLRVDIAIGVDAEYITCRSKLKEPVWDIDKLYKYLEGVESTFVNCLKQLENDIVNGTSDKKPAGLLSDIDEIHEYPNRQL